MYHYENHQYKIKAYNSQKPFSSFLPGIAGLNGIPMWVYYTNRGQGIAGFGTENKNGAIMDFVPANVAYRRTEKEGFRTFIKVDGQLHECFKSDSKDSCEQTMAIESNGLSFEEINHSIGIRVCVKYFTSTHTDYPALIRKVAIHNLKNDLRKIEVIDGLPILWPYKNDDTTIKNMANLAVAWFDVETSNRGIPFYKNRSTTEDTAAVGTIEAGHFYASYLKGTNKPLPMIYDIDILFGNHTALSTPVCFETESLNELLREKQVPVNKLPCAFTCYEGGLTNQLSFTSIVGKVASLEKLESLDHSVDHGYFEQLERAAFDLGETLTSDVETQTAYPMFDAYIKQSYLDNFLRGGYPLVFEGKEDTIIYHVYSRIHGDMEREYNDFYVEPAYYSHGIGNFRDVNQNRRNDVYFEKAAGLFNIKQFMELLQLDGQNPLSIRGSKFKVDESDLEALLVGVTSGKEILKNKLMDEFTLGALMMTVEDSRVELATDKDKFLKAVLKKATQENQAAYSHGFWVDHWTYNMDLIDNYLNVFPDRLESLMYESEYKYFRSPDYVLPRKSKYVLTEEGKVRQYDALYRDKERLKAEGFNLDASNWMKTNQGGVYTSNLLTKLMCLVINKMTNFDPSNIGIMMNSDKPGWNDAMNGLPGLFGSGSSEVIEIKRVIEFLIKTLNKYPKDIVLAEEINTLLKNYMISRSDKDDTLKTWETLQDHKEAYLEKVHTSISGKEIILDVKEGLVILQEMLAHVTQSINKALKIGQGIMPSYFIHEALEYEINEDHKHPVNGMTTVHVKAWSYRAMPLYLEAPARYLKQVKHTKEAQGIYDKIKASGMYDEQLKMYVTSESLEDESLEIGRARAFTAGWQERESVFMHMSYKYLLGLLKSGLYQAYFEAIKTSMPPFMDAEVYGRSTLENSSFIASSRNPNPKNHGRGFVSRLTGTTSELISMWQYMMMGSDLFKLEETLVFNLQPKLSKDFFDENKEVRTKLFKSVDIVYKNPLLKNTFGESGVHPVAYTLKYQSGERVVLKAVNDNYAHDIRDGRVTAIEVLLGL
jgi:hypothetical protein